MSNEHNDPINIEDFIGQMEEQSPSPPPPPVNIEITFKDVELTKLDVKPGDTLAMVVKSDDIDGLTINELKKSMTKAFPGVKVLLFGIGLNDSINFTAISENKTNTELSSCATGNFCVDCNCGKKEAYEST